MKYPILCFVTDEALCGKKPLIKVVQQVIKNGVNMVQLRDKVSSTKKFIQKARSIKKILAPMNIPLIINDRIDVALAIEASGIHVGQDDMPIAYVKKLMPVHSIIGLSVETIEQAQQANQLDVNYLGVSPVFLSNTKPSLHRAWGLEGLKKLRANTHHQLIAIGGITSNNAFQIMKNGANGLAVISAICTAENPGTASKKLYQAMITHKK